MYLFWKQIYWHFQGCNSLKCQILKYHIYNGSNLCIFFPSRLWLTARAIIIGMDRMYANGWSLYPSQHVLFSLQDVLTSSQLRVAIVVAHETTHINGKTVNNIWSCISTVGKIYTQINIFVFSEKIWQYYDSFMTGFSQYCGFRAGIGFK